MSISALTNAFTHIFTDGGDSSLIVDYMQRWRFEANPGLKIAVAVMYLRYNDLKQTLANLLGSVIKQLIQELDLLPHGVQELYQQHFVHDTTPTFEEIVLALVAVLQEFDRSYLIVDGLDECSEEVCWALEEHLQGLDAHILITSRNIDAIGDELSAFERIEIRAHEEDLELFIDQQVRKNRNLRKMIQKNPNVRRDIKDTVVKIADGM